MKSAVNITVALAAAVAAVGMAPLVGCELPATPPQAPAIEVAASVLGGYALRAVPGKAASWRLLYVAADTANLILVEGTLDARGPQLERRDILDRVDIAPGVNPVLGAFVAFQAGTQLHVVYADQELADQRVAKWIHRSVAATEPWRIGLLAPSFVPLASLAEGEDVVVYGVELGEAEVTAGAVALAGLLLVRRGEAVATAAAQPRPAVSLAVAAGGGLLPRLDYYECARDTGFVLTDGVDLVRVQPGTVARHLGTAPEGPFDVACDGDELLVLSLLHDARLPGGDASELVVTAGDQRQLVTVARDVADLALLVPALSATEADTRSGAASDRVRRGSALTLAQRGLTTLVAERALEESESPRYHLSVITLDAEDGLYTKHIIATRPGRILDFEVIRLGADVLIAMRSLDATSGPAGSAPAAHLELLSLTGI